MANVSSVVDVVVVVEEEEEEDDDDDEERQREEARVERQRVGDRLRKIMFSCGWEMKTPGHLRISGPFDPANLYVAPPVCVPW